MPSHRTSKKEGKRANIFSHLVKQAPLLSPSHDPHHLVGGRFDFSDDDSSATEDEIPSLALSENYLSELALSSPKMTDVYM